MNDVPSICTRFEEPTPYSTRLRPLPPTPPPTTDTSSIRREQLVLDTAIVNHFNKFQQYIDATFRSIERQLDGLDFRIRMIEYQLIDG